MSRSPREGKGQPGLFPAEPFDAFGPSRFRAAGEPVTGRRVTGRRPARLRKLVREHAPKLPGVYGMLDGRGRLVYVGKAKSLRSRLLSYFRVNSRDPKAGKILDHTRVLLWEQAGDEFAALLRELELIQRFGPRFNVLGRPGLQRYHYVCLGKSPAPYAYVASRPTGKELGAYGPLVSRWRSDDAVRRINDWFKLRDCPQTVPMAFSDQADLFPLDRAPKCLRLELGTCRGPCAGACSRPGLPQQREPVVEPLQRREPVAQGGRLLELERRRGLLHHRPQLPQHRPVAAVEERLGRPHPGPVLRPRARPGGPAPHRARGSGPVACPR